jgi:serine/threonine protein kinase
MEELARTQVLSLGIQEQHLPFLDIQSFTLPEEHLPKQCVDGVIKYADNSTIRCKLDYKQIVNQGQYGLIHRAIRTCQSHASTLVAVKRPRSIQLSLQPEAILQSLCSSLTEQYGLSNSVPKVHDLFLFANETRFSMDYVEGVNYVEFLTSHWSEELFLNLILQLCFILYVLEKEIGFDHRDLNAENIWIRTTPKPQIYTLILDGTLYTLSLQYQVVLLDFGFACVGDLSTRMNRLSLGGVISALDPCPKDGRDMYKILNCLLSQPNIYMRLSPKLRDEFKERMKPYEIQEASLTQILVSLPKFRIAKLTPKALIQAFAISGETLRE